VKYSDLIQYGSVHHAREKGCFRTEGRDYVVEDGDVISIDIPARRLELKVDEDELAKRREMWKPKEKKLTGFLAKYAKLVSQADEGAILS